MAILVTICMNSIRFRASSLGLPRQQGFTLIELLVVISIILLVSSMIFIGGSGGDGAKLSSSQRIVSGIAQGARGQAILKSSKVRLIIYTDSGVNSDEDKKLRYFGLIYEDRNIPGQWLAATQGTYLPEGIYFNETLSASNGWPGNIMNLEYPRQTSQVEGVEDVKLEYPRQTSQVERARDEYFYYEFNSNGTIATGFENTWLVLHAGTLKPNSSGALEVDFSEDEKQGLKGALIFRRAGTTTPVHDPSQIILRD
jgi:prepilin-type N-terminal cleavage/methylation domain-containing protein